MLLAFSIVSALFDRTRSGKGRRLQVAMQDLVMHYSRGAFITQARTGAGRRPPANNPPGGIYPCKPGGPNGYVYLMTSRANPEHWPRLLKLIGREELIGDARYDTPDARMRCEAGVDEIVAAWTRQRTKQEAMTQLSAVGVPAGAVLDSMELTNEPSFRARGILQTMTHGERTITMPTWPVRFRRRPGRGQVGAVVGASTPRKCSATGSGSTRLPSRACAGTASSETPRRLRGRAMNAGSYSIEASNPCHEHEWKVFEDVKLPDGATLIPGVVGHCNDFIEHPDLVAERLVRYAGLVGRENVLAGTDCGLGTRVGHPSICWAKFQTLAEGARRATKALWGRN